MGEHSTIMFMIVVSATVLVSFEVLTDYKETRRNAFVTLASRSADATVGNKRRRACSLEREDPIIAAVEGLVVASPPASRVKATKTLAWRPA